MTATRRDYTLDPVTFEVLKNAFITTVDLMAEQILRTCHSFVIYARDFSSALCDREGNTVMQGSQDISVHVGTLHFKAKAVIKAFEGPAVLEQLDSTTLVPPGVRAEIDEWLNVRIHVGEAR